MNRVFLFRCVVVCSIFMLSACETEQPPDSPASSTPSVVATATKVGTATSNPTTTETQLLDYLPIPSETPLATLTPKSKPTYTPFPIPKGETIVVTSYEDSGPGTLRQALQDTKPGDTITFDPTIFPPEAPATIQLTTEDNDSALPNITQGFITIDASNAGVILDGINIQGDWVNGLEIYSDRNIVRGLQIVNFSGSGIALCGGSHNRIGGDVSIGSGPLGQGNLSSKNGIGIDLCATGSYNTVTGNLVGTDSTRIEKWGNSFCGICIENGIRDSLIGPDNLIAYNDHSGILVDGPEAFGNIISRNSIHDNGFGILLRDRANTMLDPPQLSDVDVVVGIVSGTACANCTIEIFSDSSNEGEIYEGQTVANSLGSFSFNKGASFAGPNLSATATDTNGNTSEFSWPSYASIQVGNVFPSYQLQPKQSGDLDDNRIGVHFMSLWHLEPEVFPDFVLDASNILEQGFKRARFSINTVDSDNPFVPIEWGKPDYVIDPSHDEFITSMADNGITITYMLSFWDKAYKAEGGEIPIPRFKTEEDVERYLDFVQFIVSHFKDRIVYYEIWNEPNLPDRIQTIEAEDYINLVKRVVPVIRKEYPEAKIVVGGTTALIEPESRAFLFEIIKSDIMPLVDVISWHPMYGSSPEYEYHRDYYYDYPLLVNEIKDTASAHGFIGEYVADEIHWPTPAQPEDDWPTYSNIQSVKYLTRSIIMHRGVDMTVTQLLLVDNNQLYRTNQNLSTVMAGTEPLTLPIEIHSELANIVYYSFSLSNGERYIAIWNDGVAVDNEPGYPTTLTIPGYVGYAVNGIDVLHGYEQELVTEQENGYLVISDLLVKDYPIILSLSK